MIQLLIVFLLIISVLSLVTKTRNRYSNTITINNDERILFIGGSKLVLGSINDYGFISIVRDELLSHYDYTNTTVINGGIVNGMLDVFNHRFHDLVLYHNPTTVVLMFGDDDILLAVKQRKNLYETLMPFRVDLNDILMKCNASNLNVILITPTIISDLYEGSHDIDNVLEGMSAIVHEVGQQYNASAIVELRTAMINYLERTNHENSISSVLTFDGVHLNPYGHQFIASHFLYLLGLKDDDMKVLDTTELKRKLQIIPNIKLQHYKNILGDNDSDNEEDLVYNTKARDHIERIDTFLNKLVYDVENFQLDANPTEYIREYIPIFNNNNETNIGSTNDMTYDEHIQQYESPNIIEDFNLDMGLFRDVGIDSSNLYDNDYSDNTDPNNNNDNAETVENLYVYEYHNDINTNINTNTNDIDNADKPKQELFFDFDAFLRENIITNTDNTEEL